MSDLRIGTAGWSYPSPPGSWTGIVYPVRQGRIWRGAKFDELSFYAERFDTVEVNSSFYRVPSPETTRKWAARTPAGFEFAVKLYQKLTHLAREAEPMSAAEVDEVKRSLDPLASAGRLGPLLAQFPASFKADDTSRDYLAWLLETFRDYRVAVELRHRSWSDAIRETLGILDASKAAWVQIDEPKFHPSITQNFLPNISGFYYLRLHGRNARAWWKHDHPHDRYNYLYAAEELDPFVEIAEAVKTLVKRMYLYTNNHFEGKAVANALMLKERLDLPTHGGFPPAFLQQYPELGDAVRPLDATGSARPTTLPL